MTGYSIGCHATVPQIWLDRGIVLVAITSLIARLKGGEEFTRLGFLNLPPRYCPYMYVCFIIRILLFEVIPPCDFLKYFFIFFI
jgi:hypothetical protein